MWNKPWNMKEGFLIGGGLIFAGLALQLSVGPVVWDAFAWPVNGIVLAGFYGDVNINGVLAEESICLPMDDDEHSCNTSDGVGCGADHHHGTDTTAG